MRKRKFRIEKKTEKQEVASSILYGERKIKVCEYYIYFYENLLSLILGFRTYLELKRIEYGRYEYSKYCTWIFATSFDTRSDAEDMIKLINEHPENFTLK